MEKPFKGIPVELKKPSTVKFWTHAKTIYKHYADFLIDSALVFEEHDKELSVMLLNKAKKIRPSGPLITKLLNRLKNEDFNSAKVNDFATFRDILIRLHNSLGSINEVHKVLNSPLESTKQDSLESYWSSQMYEGLSYLNSLESSYLKQNGLNFPLCNSSIMDIVINAIKSQTPLSLIRLGDGEAAFLGQGLEYQSEVYKTWFGQEPPKNKYLKEIGKLLAKAIKSSDIIGLPDFRQQVFNWGTTNKRLHDSHKVLNQHAMKWMDKRLCAAYINLQWHQEGTYELLFKNAKKVSLITGHDPECVRGYLTDTYNVQVNHYFKVPIEQKFSRKFGQEVDSSHYPNEFLSVSEQLGQLSLKGEVFLIGAGILGKYYAHIIKLRGGIALDIGSSFDYWLGHQTRNFSRNS